MPTLANMSLHILNFVAIPPIPSHVFIHFKERKLASEFGAIFHIFWAKLVYG